MCVVSSLVVASDANPAGSIVFLVEQEYGESVRGVCFAARRLSSGEQRTTPTQGNTLA